MCNVVSPIKVPEGMKLVGYRCMAAGHFCLIPLNAVPPNHHGYWVPVYMEIFADGVEVA